MGCKTRCDSWEMHFLAGFHGTAEKQHCLQTTTLSICSVWGLLWWIDRAAGKQASPQLAKNIAVVPAKLFPHTGHQDTASTITVLMSSHLSAQQWDWRQVPAAKAVIWLHLALCICHLAFVICFQGEGRREPAPFSGRYSACLGKRSPDCGEGRERSPREELWHKDKPWGRWRPLWGSRGSPVPWSKAPAVRTEWAGKPPCIYFVLSPCSELPLTKKGSFWVSIQAFLSSH